MPYFGSLLEEGGSAWCSWEALHRPGLTQKPWWLSGFNLSRSTGVTRAGEGQCICTIKKSFRWYYNNRLLLQVWDKANIFLQPGRFHCHFLLLIFYHAHGPAASCLTSPSAGFRCHVAHRVSLLCLPWSICKPFISEYSKQVSNMIRTADSELLPSSPFQCPFPSFCLFNWSSLWWSIWAFRSSSSKPPRLS